jgi:GAF domain-containing protein/anti-sigma regulatory factor (Ser/Thr protein kinase)
VVTDVGSGARDEPGAPEQRDAFLLAFTDAVRGIADARAVMRIASERLARAIDADGVGYGELDETGAFLTIAEDWCGPGVTSLVGRHRLDDFGPAADLLRAGEVVVLDDVQAPAVSTDATVAAAFAGLGIRAGLAVPLLKEQTVVALLFAHHLEPHVWTAEERALVPAVAERTWEAVSRARAERAMQRDLDDAVALQTVSNQLILEDDVDALFARILDAAIGFARADAGSMQLLDPETEQLELIDLRGFHPDSGEYWGQIHDHSVTSCGEALRTGERVIVPDFEACDWLVGTRDLELYRSSGLRSVQTTPLITRDGHTVGMLSTHWRVAYEPTERDLHLIDVLARQAADLIERRQTQALRRRAFQQEREARLRAERLERRAMRLQQLTGGLAEAETVEAVGRIVVTDFIDAVDGSGALLYLYDASAAELRLLDHHDHPAAIMRRPAAIAIAEPLPVTETVREHRSIFLADAASARARYPRLEEALTAHPDPGAAWAMLPLNAAGRTVGALVVAYAEPRSFDALDRAHLLAAAAAAGQALQRVLLLGTERAAQRRTELLARITAELASATGLEAMLAGTVAVLADGFAVSAVVLAPDGREVAAAGGRAQAPDEDGIDDDALQLRGPLGEGSTLQLVATTTPDRPFDDGDRELLDEVRARVGSAAARTTLHAHEHAVSIRLQESLVAGQDVPPDSVSVTQAYLPGRAGMQVGGDWTDIVALDECRVAVTVGDVVGSGIDAAATMGRLRSALAAILTTGAAPDEAIAGLDRFARRVTGAEYTTVAICILDTARGELAYACAGHPPPLLLDGDEAEFLMDARSAPLCVPGAARVTARRTISPGATVVLYTDGLVERRTRPLDEGMRMLAAVAREAPAGDLGALRERILQRLVDPSEQRDDIALLAARVERLSSERFFHRIQHADDLAGLRQAARAWLEGQAIATADATDVVLALSEAAANAVEHGHAGAAMPVDVTLALSEGVVTGVVRDHGRWRTPRDHPDRGRGLAIMRAVSDAVEVDRRDGTTLSFRRRVRRPEEAA